MIVEKFREIKELGFVKSKRPYSTGIGKTFEDYLGVTENNEIGPDFAGFEVVSKRTQTSTFLSLFTKSPSHPRSVNTILLERYGEEYEGIPECESSIRRFSPASSILTAMLRFPDRQ